MPEGHSVHRIANHFNDVFAGHSVTASSPQGRFSAGAQVLNGHRIEESFAVGKHLFVPFEHGVTLRVHLGIYGAWDFALSASGSQRLGQTGEYARGAIDQVEVGRSMGAPRRVRVGETENTGELADFPPEPRGAVRLRLLTDTVCADLRGPTACEVLDPQAVEDKIATLGPDPLVEPGKRGLQRFYERAHKRQAPIRQVLMDQSAIAGIGNIYRAEMLFRAGIDPFTPAKVLSADTYAALWKDWTKLLRVGVETGVIVTRGFSGKPLERALASLEDRHWVYGRAGLPCRKCGTSVAMTEMQGRKLYWCPQCQQ